MVHTALGPARRPSSPQLSMQYSSGEWQPMETTEAFWLSLRVSLSLLGASILVSVIVTRIAVKALRTANASSTDQGDARPA